MNLCAIAAFFPYTYLKVFSTLAGYYQGNRCNTLLLTSIPKKIFQISTPDRQLNFLNAEI